MFAFLFALQRCFICWNERLFLQQMSYIFFLKRAAIIQFFVGMNDTGYDTISCDPSDGKVGIVTLGVKCGRGCDQTEIARLHPIPMMTSSNGNIFRVTGPLCEEFTGHRWIPFTKASNAELWCFLWSSPWMNDWVDNRGASDLRRHWAHYDAIVMLYMITLLATSGTTSIA